MLRRVAKNQKRNKTERPALTTTSVIPIMAIVTKCHIHLIFLTHCPPTPHTTTSDNVSKCEITSCHKYPFPLTRKVFVYPPNACNAIPESYFEAVFLGATHGTNDYIIQDCSRKQMAHPNGVSKECRQG